VAYLPQSMHDSPQTYYMKSSPPCAQRPGELPESCAGLIPNAVQGAKRGLSSAQSKEALRDIPEGKARTDKKIAEIRHPETGCLLRHHTLPNKQRGGERLTRTTMRTQRADPPNVRDDANATTKPVRRVATMSEMKRKAKHLTPYLGT